MRVVVAFLLTLLSFTASAVEIRPPMPIADCAQHLPYGKPNSQRSNTVIICREGYALEYDKKAKIPIWVAYTMSGAKALGCFPRTPVFRKEPSIDDDDSSSIKDYAKSGYDIGHLANNGDMRWSQEAEIESNLLTNAAPMKPGLNRGSWKMLEDQTRAWAALRGANILIYIASDYDPRAPSTIGKRRVTIPVGFAKILIDQTTLEVQAFYYAHEEDSSSPEEHLTSFANVQEKTRVIFPIPMTPHFSAHLWPARSKSARKQKFDLCSLT